MSERADPAAGGQVEGAHGHEGGRTDDRVVPRRVFLIIGALVAVLAVIYGSTAYEEAGTVMLAVSAVFALSFGVYLWLQQREVSREEADAVAGVALREEEQYLPHASVWPFLIGIGAATVANGLVLGIWVLIPGLGLMAIGIGGWVGQSRRRD